MRRKILSVLLLAVFAIPIFLLEAEPLKYDSHGKRDPLVPLIGQERMTGTVPFADITSVDEVKIEGIAVDMSGARMAVVNGELVKEGYGAGEVEVKAITKNSVKLNIGGRDYTINLPEEGGRK